MRCSLKESKLSEKSESGWSLNGRCQWWWWMVIVGSLRMARRQQQWQRMVLSSRGRSNPSRLWGGRLCRLSCGTMSMPTAWSTFRNFLSLFHLLTYRFPSHRITSCGVPVFSLHFIRYRHLCFCVGKNFDISVCLSKVAGHFLRSLHTFWCFCRVSRMTVEAAFRWPTYQSVLVFRSSSDFSHISAVFCRFCPSWVWS